MSAYQHSYKIKGVDIMNNRWNKKEPKILYKPRVLNTFERMRIYAEIDKQYILEDIKSYAKSEKLISDRGMRLVNWNAMYDIYVNEATMEYSQFENMKNAINLYLEYHKEENLDKDFYVVEIEEAYTTHVEILAKNEYEAEELIEEKYNQGLYFEDLRKEWVTNFFATKIREPDIVIEARRKCNYNAIA